MLFFLLFGQIYKKCCSFAELALYFYSAFIFLHYYKETNPLLQKQDIVYFSNVASCGTMTAVSLPCMFSAYSRKNFDTDDAAYTQNLLDIMQTTGRIPWRPNNV